MRIIMKDINHVFIISSYHVTSSNIGSTFHFIDCFHCSCTLIEIACLVKLKLPNVKFCNDTTNEL